MKCLNKNVLIGLAAVALVLLALKPSWLLTALPLLALAACPLSMIFMMRHMSGPTGHGGSCDTGKPGGAPARQEAESHGEIHALQPELQALKAAYRTPPDAATTT
jgi:Protein of unknown function (DUF2933)